LATAIYIASSTDAGAFIVIDVDTLSNGIPSNSISISARESIQTPTFPTSPSAIGLSESTIACHMILEIVWRAYNRRIPHE